MITIIQFRKLAMSFPETEELPHFEKASFRVSKKIFATLNEKEKRITIKLSEIDQDVFSKFDRLVIYPVPNKWGKQGWTHIELSKVNKEMLLDALTAAYCFVAPKRLSKSFFESEEE